MKVTHWNFFREKDKISGGKRYEDELFNHMRHLVDLKRSQIENRNYYTYLSHYESFDADIIHATFQMLSPLKITKQPKNFVLTVHDIIPTVYFSTYKKLKHLWQLSEMCIKFADKIITDSEFTKNELINKLKIKEEKIHVVPLGVSEYYKQYEQSICRRMFNFQPEKKYILIVSSNEPWKNMEIIKEIADGLNDNYRIIKVGYGEKIAHRKILSLGHIPESEMPYLYSACDLFVHPSLYEGFGLPCLEAMSCGCPVISSNATSLPEVVNDAGYLLPPTDVAQFLNTINTLLSSNTLYSLWKPLTINTLNYIQ